MMGAHLLTVDEIRSTLSTRRLGHRLVVRRELPSTNSEAARIAQAGAAHGTVVVAESQTTGRGRHARTWFSPAGVNLYASILIRPVDVQMAIPDWLCWIPLATGFAAAESIQSVTGFSPTLKWPNDLLAGEKKIGGLLCEGGTDSRRHPFVILGLGLNVNGPADSFPAELAGRASSLLVETGRPVDRARLLAQVLLDVEHVLDILATEGPSRLRLSYLTRCTTIGKRVRVVMNAGQELIGEALSIGGDGALHLRPSVSSTDQAIIEVRAADVIHLRE